MCIFNKSSKLWTIVDLNISTNTYNITISGLFYDSQTNKISFIRSNDSWNGHLYFFDTQNNTLSGPVYVGNSYNAFFLQHNASAKLFKTSTGYSLLANGRYVYNITYPGAPSITFQDIYVGFYSGGTTECNGIHYYSRTNDKFCGVNMETGSVIREIDWPLNRLGQRALWKDGMMAVRKDTNTIYYITGRDTGNGLRLWCCKVTL
jgi:hypothetical protein